MNNNFKQLDTYFNNLVNINVDNDRYKIFDILKNKLPKNSVCCEIGVFNGGFSEKIIEYLNPSKMIMVDPWKSNYEDDSKLSRQSQEYFDYVYNNVVNKFSNNDICDIKRLESVEASKYYEGESIDFIYIDGNHFKCYEDICMWYPKLKENGIIAGHDYHYSDQQHTYVERDVKEFFGTNFLVLEQKECNQWYHIKQNKNVKSLCCILNYNVNENANWLYNQFSKYMETIVIDGDSVNPYPYFMNVGNFYYTGLFNNAIKLFKHGNYRNLLMMTSDICMSEESIEYVSNIANNDMKDIGIYSLQTDKYSKDYHNNYNDLYKHTIKDNLYCVDMMEGFFNLYHHDVVINHKEIPLDVNKIGVCIPEYSCNLSKILNKKNVIDITHTIHHPNSKGYDSNYAHSFDTKFRNWYNNELNRFKQIYLY